jgi:hypothetical protein
MSDLLAARLKKIIAAAQERGYVTYAELNEAMPVEEFTGEQIEDVATQFAQLGLELVDFPDGLRPVPVEIDRETACERSIRRMETAAAALRLGKVKFACQLMEGTLAELRPFADG